MLHRFCFFPGELLSIILLKYFTILLHVCAKLHQNLLRNRFMQLIQKAYPSSGPCGISTPKIEEQTESNNLEEHVKKYRQPQTSKWHLCPWKFVVVHTFLRVLPQVYYHQQCIRPVFIQTDRFPAAILEPVGPCMPR